MNGGMDENGTGADPKNNICLHRPVTGMAMADAFC